MRKVVITKDVNMWSLGSVLIEAGNTKVICNVTADNNPPAFCLEKNQGWLTAEYSMLPASTNVRSKREVKVGKITGRTAEIQRLIGRSLRAVIDLSKIQGISITVDCDVIQADGGTRTASITGACVALKLACDKLLAQGRILSNPFQEYIAAISVGMKDNEIILDMNYQEDSQADVDMNVVMTESGKLIEIQATAELAPFDRKDLDNMLALAQEGIDNLIRIQYESLDI